MSGDDNLFEKLGLEIRAGEVEVGQTYPLYGMITKILDETFENFTIEVNYQATLRCNITTPEAVEKIKQRAFEPGIFVSEITNINPVQGKCSTIVFGRMNTQAV